MVQCARCTTAHPLAVSLAAESLQQVTACPCRLKLGYSALFSGLRPQLLQNRLPLFLLRLVAEQLGSEQRPFEHHSAREVAATLSLGPATAGPGDR